jgi:hypothetical protein
MPNRFTRVPTGPVPSLPPAGRALLPLADAFMVLMLSRPASGSLRQTWVTPATLWLCVAVVVVGVPLAVVVGLVGALGEWAFAWRVVAVLVIIGLVVGSGAVAVVGALQRR